MASYRTGAFGRRLRNPPPEDVAEQNMFPPSREERMQTRWMIGTTAISLLILGIGLLLRFTVFADLYKPKPFMPQSTLTSTPVATASPLVALPTPSPIAVSTPRPALIVPPPVKPVKTET